MIRIYIIGLLLATAMGCRKAPTREYTSLDDAPAVLKEYLIATASTTAQKKAEMTLTLAREICPSLLDSVFEDRRGAGWWHLNALATDLDGDGQNEHVLLFWDDSEFYALLCIMKQISGEWRGVYATRLQGWSYSPPTLFVANNESRYKWVVCTYESISHASGINESRCRVLSIQDGEAKVLLDYPEKFHNYCMGLAISVDSIHKDTLLLDVEYTYYFSSGVVPGSEMFTGRGKVEMLWDEATGAFTESYSDSQPLDGSKFRFLNEKKQVEDRDFSLVWQKELVDARRAANEDEAKFIDALLGGTHMSSQQGGSDVK